MRLLTDGCVIPRISAARAVVCSSITAFKACNCLILIVSHPIQSGIAAYFSLIVLKGQMENQIDTNRWFTTVGWRRASNRVNPRLHRLVVRKADKKINSEVTASKQRFTIHL